MPSLRDLVDSPELAKALPPQVISQALGELLLLLARLLIQSTATLGTTQTEKPEASDRLLSVTEVSRILNVRPARVYDLVRRDTLPAVHVGKYIRIRGRDLERWIAGQREK
jgi:excisionase family DNA binding protein